MEEAMRFLVIGVVLLAAIALLGVVVGGRVAEVLRWVFQNIQPYCPPNLCVMP